jgi:superfamily II DNA or RNA helicase
MSAVPYDRKQITRWLGAHTVAKAQDYVDAVSELEWDNDTLTASVQGTEPLPYEVTVDFEVDDIEPWLEGDCSCPVGYNCKHVAAVLLAGLTLAPAHPTAVRSQVVQWLEGFQARHRQPPQQERAKPKALQALAYVIVPAHFGGADIVLRKIRLAADGTIRSVDEPWDQIPAALVKSMKFIQEEDLTILRRLWIGRLPYEQASYGLRGVGGAELLHKILKTGRALAGDARGAIRQVRPLRLSSARTGVIEWKTESKERLRCVLATDPPASLLVMTDPFWYVDDVAGVAGVVECAGRLKQVADLLGMPPISLEEAPLVGAVLRDIAPEVPLPPAHDRAALPLIDVEPVPVLTLTSVSAHGPVVAPSGRDILDYAMLSFDYAGIAIAAINEGTLHRNANGEVVQVKRRPESEQRRWEELHQAGLQRKVTPRLFGLEPLPDGLMMLADADAWLPFMNESLPALKTAGWRCVIHPSFRFNVILVDDIEGTVTATDDGWFDLEMGIHVDGRAVRLEPLLADLFRRDGRWLSGSLDNIIDTESIDLNTDRHERLRLRAGRLKPLVRILIDLFDAPAGSGALRLSPWDAARLGDLEDVARWQFHGADSIRALARRLEQGGGVREVPIPRGLNAELRDYQRQGFYWLQFLREHELSGVLADDMGLGKTLQALTHILAEYEAGRLDRPALIVMPTSLIHNWRQEAARFAPALKVLDLQGTARKDRFDEIGSHHLVLTTYALLWRDHEALAEHEYHLLVLDESQYVKNAATKTATAIRALKSRHRLALSGTPLENHLGELWAQFDFLLPGFLGTQKDFTQRWRTPIEKRGDTVRRDLLARRLRPFLLRRRKDEVAKELPAKTTIVRTVELVGGQRDLYETVRSAMQERVRSAIGEQGFARSHIIMLDALLKLRQVCCDPRLLKLAKASRVRESSKLDLLMEMVPTLLEEGRRILVFSQFTSMLALIGAALRDKNIGYLTLTGDTTDRATPLGAFANGEAHVFLISLKAGGVGLNLTSADTVIHYDPWWNPATETQATDRAHRIGQTKPVFVYKLVASGSIEEKILALQAKKAALADLILSDDAGTGAKFSPQDLEALFAPLPSLSASPREA